MERWVTLFQIFFNSPSPEADASLWFHHQHQHQHQHHPANPPSPPTTSAFLSLLLSPAPSPSFQLHSTTSSPPTPLIFIQTLPLFIQSRLLSFLTAEAPRFCCRRLRSLATQILNSDLPSSSYHPGFWVHRAARNLLDTVSPPESTPSELLQEEQFDALPHWLQSPTIAATPLLPWLPLPPGQLPRATLRPPVFFPDKPECTDLVMQQEEEVQSRSPPPPLDPQACDKATALKAELLASDSTSEALRIAHEMQQLRLDSGPGNHLTLLGMIEPWEADDETLSVLLSHLSSNGRLGSDNWPSHVICSISLPKFLNLRNPASRVLLSATISFCKLHPTAAVEALIFPLTLRKEGINVVLCDVLTRIIKECLHPSHVSAFCQRLLCGQGKDRRPVCLPCHRDLISEELVWTEATFTLFQHILNRDVHLTPDTTEQLVSVIDEMAGKFSRSLKFGNFLLCFVTKCKRAANFHKVLLETVAEKTDTFVTKSVLSKLGGP